MRRTIILGLLAACAGASLYGVEVGAQEQSCNGKPATITVSYGSDDDDVFVGGEGSDWFHGEGGNDTICGGGGPDRLVAGPGDDYVDGGAGNDRVSGCEDPFYVPESCEGVDDADALSGGPGDDALFGLGDDDSLDGGDGFDAVEGGDGTDSCLAGERYEECEATDPPEELPACGNDVDDDGDGEIDFTDPGCSRWRDPTEDVTDDPACSNGNDDEGDGYRDYPADEGCASASDDNEYSCPDSATCMRPSLYAQYNARFGVFKGGVMEDRDGCRVGRVVLVRRHRPGWNPIVARVRADRNGRWRVREEISAGSYVAVAPRSTYVTPEGDEPSCRKLRSNTVRVG